MKAQLPRVRGGGVSVHFSYFTMVYNPRNTEKDSVFLFWFVFWFVFFFRLFCRPRRQFIHHPSGKFLPLEDGNILAPLDRGGVVVVLFCFAHFASEK